MKKFTVILLSLMMGQVLANSELSNQEKMFSILVKMYQQEVDQDFCPSEANECHIKLAQLDCIRGSRCHVIFNKENGLSHYVAAGKSGPYYLSLYLAMRRSSSSLPGMFERYGRRYRPNFKIVRPMECFGAPDFSNVSCI